MAAAAHSYRLAQRSALSSCGRYNSACYHRSGQQWTLIEPPHWQHSCAELNVPGDMHQHELRQLASRRFVLIILLDTLQDAKAAALGPRHLTNTLPEVLTEPLLSTVQSQAATAAGSGWFWTYQLGGVKVCESCSNVIHLSYLLFSIS